MRIGYCVSLKELKQLEQGMAEFVDLSGHELTALSVLETHSIAKRLKNLQIECVGIHAAFPSQIKIAGKGTDAEAAIRYFQQLVGRAEILQVKFIGIGSPQSRALEAGADREEADSHFASLLSAFCDCAGETRVLLESVNRKETNYINSLDEAYNIVQKAKRKNIGLILDLYHSQIENEDIGNLNDEIWKNVYYLHIADPHERKYPGYTTKGKLKHSFHTAVRKAERVCEIAVEGNAMILKRDMEECNMVMKRWIKEAVLC